MSTDDSNQTSKPTQGTPDSTAVPASPRQYELKYSSKEGTYFSQLYNQPLVTTLNSFSHVANFVRNPYELINNVDEFVKHRARQTAPPAANSGAATSRAPTHNSGPCTTQPTSCLARDGLIGASVPQERELDEFTGGRFHPASSSSIKESDDCLADMHQLPPPALPQIECTNQQRRLPPLTIDEYIENFQQQAPDHLSDDGAQIEKITMRIFRGSMDSNLLRRVLWPVIFNILKHPDKIVKRDGGFAYEIVEDEQNLERWAELKNKFDIYYNQWRSILPEQESRFSTFRERKSLIERDVIRCDRLHPYYVNDPNHLEALTTMLMTYMMYDFDIGYVQGMSDLAAPILYIFNGDLTRAFWVFTEVMKLFRRNFELSQKTIQFQLSCLYKLITITDPCFAQYLTDHESSNCFFAFRAIVCQFKRELMKEDEDDYRKVLFLWDTVWCCQRLSDMRKQREQKESNMKKEMDSIASDGITQLKGDEMEVKISKEDQQSKKSDIKDKGSCSPSKKSAEKFSRQSFYASFDPNQADIPRFKLSNTEKFVLALCLSLIRRERDRIIACKLDGTEILQHFIDPKLGDDLDNFIEHATNIYSFLQNDFDTNRLHEEEEPQKSAVCTNDDGYDLLNDYLIISAAGD